MAILPMHYIGKDAILRQKTIKIKDISDPTLKQLAEDMIESMHHYSGVGLAANQIGSTKRICVIQMPDDPEATVLLNLEIIGKEGEREVTEGCLSLPGWQGWIPRAEKVWARGTGLDGKTIKYKGVDGLLAQALEHECDHLDGVLYIDHVRSKDDLYEVTEGEEEDGEGETRQRAEQTSGAER